MAEEHEHHTHGLAHGHHESGENKTAMYWQLGIAATGLVVAVLFFMNGNQQKKQQPQYELVHGSQDFIPNPTDISIGSIAAPMYWPALPTSGTPHHPKTHHKGDHDSKEHKKGHEHSKKSNDHKGYGKSPVGSSHGHTITHHTHNPVVVHQHSKGKANG